MGLFKEIATPLVQRGVPIIPLRPKTKVAFLRGWENLATTDVRKVEEWDKENDSYNGACVAFAKPEGVWFFEIDRPGYQKVVEEKTGQKLPATFMVRSSPGRGHYYFKQTPASIQLGNTQAKDEHGKELWSARIDNRYVVAPGSYHPTSGLRYEVINPAPIIPAPDWLVQWIASNKTDDIEQPRRTGVTELDDEEPISEGGRNSALASIAGKARQVLEMDKDQLFAYLLSVNEKRCKPPLPESEVKTIAYSIGRYAIQDNSPTPVPFGYKTVIPDEDDEPVKFVPVPYPAFPYWVMTGTSLGDGLVAPICEKNESYAEFIFMPAMVMMMNYSAFKVEVKDRRIIPNMFMISIGWPERAFKSEGITQASEHLQAAGMLDYGLTTSKAEGRTLIWQAGSTEGLGLDMSRTTCKNALLIYDEFKTLVDKASIESSSMIGHLLQIYDSAMFSNTKSGKNFLHKPKEYCGSLIANCADQAFPKQWARIPDSGDSGWMSRFFFLYQPETMKDFKPYVYVNTGAGAAVTRERMDKAMKQRVFEITNPDYLAAEALKIGPRYTRLIEKIALYFAIDRGMEEIDESCIERAAAIVKYGVAVKDYIQARPSLTREGALQGLILQALQQNKGAMLERDLERKLHSYEYGTSVWSKAYQGLILYKWIRVDGVGTKGSPKQVILMRVPE